MTQKDLTFMVENLVATSYTGRALASFGGKLTEKEKEYAEFVYNRLKAGENIRERSPVTAERETTRSKRKIALSGAVNWFIRKYPKASLPLQEKLKQKVKKSKVNLTYGFRENNSFEDLNSSFYIDLIKETTGISDNEAGVLYHGVLAPFMKRIETEKNKGLTKMLIKV